MFGSPDDHRVYLLCAPAVRSPCLPLFFWRINRVTRRSGADRSQGRGSDQRCVPAARPAEPGSGDRKTVQCHRDRDRGPVARLAISGRLQRRNRHWGDQKQLDQLLQAYAVEKAKIEARKRGHTVTEQQLADGSVKLTIQLAGGAA